MEGWLCWTETDSHYILRGGLLLEPFASMWSKLRDAVVFYMRSSTTEPGQHAFTPAARKAASANLLGYGKLVEQVISCAHSQVIIKTAWLASSTFMLRKLL